MKAPRDKYLNDASYHRLVDMMVDQINKCNFTPSELREAAILASIIYEERNIRYMTNITPEIEDALNKINNWTKSPNNSLDHDAA